MSGHTARDVAPARASPLSLTAAFLGGSVGALLIVLGASSLLGRRRCCTAGSAECSACMAGMPVDRFCAARAGAGVCREYIEAAFEPIGGGDDRACYGDPDNYVAVDGNLSLADCKVHCMTTAGCQGVEHSILGHCSVWTKPINATEPVHGYACLRYHPPAPASASPLQFELVAGGANQSCRAVDPNTTAANHHELYSNTTTLEACKARCLGTGACTGVEFHRGRHWCRVWEVPVAAGVRVQDCECFRARRRREHRDDPAASGRDDPATSGAGAISASALTSTPTGPAGRDDPFEAIDGGTGRACRGLKDDDDSDQYFMVQPGAISLEECKNSCANARVCTAIEYSFYGRCEVWTIDVESTSEAQGFRCFRYRPPPGSEGKGGVSVARD